MSTMTNSVAILPKVPFSPPSQRNGEIQGSALICVRTMSAIQMRRLKIQTFAGLRGSTSFLGTSGSSFPTIFYTKMMNNNALLVPRGGPKRGVVRAMFERFTEKAVKVATLAQEESRSLGHSSVGTEQILLGLISEGTGIAAKVLNSMGLDLKDTRMEIEKLIGRGGRCISVDIPFSPRAKLVFERSLDEARKLGQNFIGTEHMLLGLLREGEGVAACVLENLGVDPNRICERVVQMIGETKELDAHGSNSSDDMMQTLQEFSVKFTKFVQEEISRDMSRLIAEFEWRVKKIVEEIKEAKEIIVLIDKLDTLLGATMNNNDPLVHGGRAKRDIVKIMAEAKDIIRDFEKLDTLVGAKMMNNNDLLVHGGRAKRDIVRALKFEQFTEKAIKIIMLAQEESRRLGHNSVGTEQILLGLISECTGIAAKVLKYMGLNLKDARMEVEKIVGRGSGVVSNEIPFTPRAKLVLEYTLDEAQKLGHHYVGSEHLLLGLLRERECVAARVLENFGVDPNSIHKQVLQRVDEETK